MRSLIFPLFAVFISLVYAQEATIVDANGDSVVVDVTTNVLGLPTTQTLETLPATTAQATQTTTSTTPDVNAGPVGQPAATSGVPHGPTPYTYTTIVAGETQRVVATFSPTFPETVLSTAPATGTVLDYSEWLSMYGTTNTVSSATKVVLLSRGVFASLVSSVIICVVGGAWIFGMS
ncbi:hypothetical protein K435DRAFT_748651 [Dendrothele bispora CBS 962.96]|uniref:Uncharacterized protein n=1 Tax=Dendrothele bispora (strain CBS 962.96) TaxID=1314807 RepID=A0A4S8MJJ1_DENBC|nr:hypothetical protein K435DRAFT_748651 [Dendrothele bispora CBS 962.96]